MPIRAVTLGLLTLLSTIPLSTQASISWSFRYQDVPTLNNGDAAADVNFTYTDTVDDSDDNIVVVSGWGAEKPGGDVVNQDDNLYHWQGLGLDRPNDGHVIDNGGWDEFIIFEFSEAVSLSSYSFGWVYEDDDWDSTVLAYSPDSLETPFLSPAGDSIASMTDNGWSAIGHYGKTPFGGNPGEASVDITDQTQVTDNEVYSSYWAIGAYMESISASTFGNDPVGTGVWDGFKLSGITVETRPGGGNEVPVPTTLLLMLLGLAYFRRRDDSEKINAQSSSISTS